MYSRNFRPQTQNENDSVPVQSFEDSFSADAFMNDMARRAYRGNEENADFGEKKAEQTQNATPRAEASRSPGNATSTKRVGLAADDLLLIGVLLLCLNDAEKSEDLFLPLLIAVLLLS